MSLNHRIKKSRARPAFPNVWPQRCLLTLIVYLASVLGNFFDYITPLRGETHGLRSHSWQNFLHFFLSYFRGPSFFLSWVARLNMWARCGFVVFDRYAKDKQSKQRHWLKLGKKRRESSKRNYYIISPRVIIIAIIIWIITRFKKFVKILRFYFRMTHRRRKLVLS